MSAIESILVATDFSPHAERALDQALVLAKALQARIHLVYAVYMPVQPALPELSSSPAILIGGMRDYGRDKVGELADKVKAEKVDCEVHVEDGVPSRVVLDLAKSLDVGLIAVGRRGQSALEHVVLGSVAERVLRLATCPVLTVPDDAGELSFDQILVPTDLSGTAMGALEIAQAIGAAMAPSKLLVTHAHATGIQTVRFLAESDGRVSIGTGVPILGSVSPESAARAAELLDPARNGGVASELVTGEGLPEHLILETARERKVDLIVMGTHGRRGISHLVLGSVAERVVHGAECSVITVRTQEAAG